MRVRTVWENSEPRPAMPVAMPTWRKVELMPEAIPARSGVTTPIAVEASGGLTSPTPAPATMNPGIRCVQSTRRLRPSHHQDSHSDQRQAGGDQQPNRHVGGQAPGERRGEHDAARDHQQAQARLKRRIAEHVLQVEGQIEQQREHSRRDRKRGDQAAGEGRLSKQAEVEHRALFSEPARRTRTRSSARPRRPDRRRSQWIPSRRCCP